jgi:hypothetical protein
MSKARAKMLAESAKELTPDKNLARASEHVNFIITTVGTIGTLLAGAGTVTAAIAINRTTLYLWGVPVVPVGALLTSVLAGLSVGVALWGRRPNFTDVNPSRLDEVDAWFANEIDRKKGPVRWSARFFIWAAFTAVATSALAGLLIIIDPTERPRNLASLSTTVAEKGVVTMHLGGAVDGLDPDADLTVTVTSNAPVDEGANPAELIHVDVRPDADGKVTLDSEAPALAGSTRATATLSVDDGDKTTDDDPTWTLETTYPEVPETPDPNTAATAQIAAATPAVISLVADYVTTHGNHLPRAITEALKGIEIAGWVKSELELMSKGQLSNRQTARLQVIIDWQTANTRAARFNRRVGALFVWARQHHNTIPGPQVQVDGRPLGEWAAKQRGLYAAKELTAKQVALLESVPGWTWST